MPSAEAGDSYNINNDIYNATPPNSSEAAARGSTQTQERERESSELSEAGKERLERALNDLASYYYDPDDRGGFDAEREVFDLGHKALPRLKEFFDAHRFDPFDPSYFAHFENALAEPENLDLVLQALEERLPAYDIGGEEGPNLIYTVGRLVYGLRERNSNEELRNKVAARLISLFYGLRGQGSRYVLNDNEGLLSEVIALTGTDAARQFVENEQTLFSYELSRFFDYRNAPDRFLQRYHFRTWDEYTRGQNQSRENDSSDYRREDVHQDEGTNETTTSRTVGEIEHLNREAGLKPEQISKFLKNGRGQPEVDGALLREMYIELADAYYKAFGYSFGQRQEKRRQVKLEDRFIASVEDVMTEIGPLSDLERRVVASDLITIYGLVVNGGLDELYENYVAGLKKEHHRAPHDPEKIKEIKENLALGFVSRVRAKNKEQKLAESAWEPVTYGVEIETYNYLRGSVSGYLEPASLNVPSKKIEEIKKRFSFPGDSPYTTAGRLQQAVTTYPEGLYPLSKAKAASFGKEGEKHLEARSYPVASPRSQLREMLTAMKAGGFEGTLGLHETLGGIDLTAEHTEIMDVTAISIAAGFVRPWYGHIVPEDLGSDKYPKTSDIGGYNEVYFPAHKRRFGTDSKTVPYANQNEGTKAVECRSVPVFESGSYGQMVRDVTFKYLAAWGIRAVQAGESRELNEQEQAEKAAYEKMIKTWQEVLAKAGLENPGNGRGERFDSRPGGIKYEKLITQLNNKAAEDPEFSAEVRTMVREYQKTVRPLIGY